MFSSVIVHVAFGLQLLLAAGNPSPAVVGQAAGQVSARSATDRAEARVATTSKALNKRFAEYKQLKSKYAKQKNEEIEKKEAWDKLMVKMDQMNLSEQEKELIKQEIQHKEAELYRLS